MVQLKELPLSLARQATLASFGAQISPADRYLLITYESPGGAEKRNILVETQSLRITNQWAFARLGDPLIKSISDKGLEIAVVADPKLDHAEVRLEGADKVLCWSPSDSSWWYSCVNASFVTDDMLFGWAGGAGGAMRLFRTDGAVILDQNLGNKDVLNPLHPVIGGGRFAIAVYKGKGGSTFFDIGPSYSLREVRVYDGETGKLIYTLDGPSHKIKSLSALAVSPDGSLLGLIDQNGMLAVYRLP